MGIGHFDVVTEHVVVAYLQRAYAGGFGFAGLHRCQKILAAERYFSKVVQFGVGGEGIAAAEHAGFVAELGADALGYCVAGVELFTDSTEPLLSARCAQLLYGADCFQGIAYLYHFPRKNPFACQLGNQAFKVAHIVEALYDFFAEVGLAEEVLHYVQALVDGFHVLERK